MKKYYIIRSEETEEYIMSIYVGRTTVVKPIAWTNYIKNAIHFENADEAKATIAFIGAVMDWELEEQLQIIEIID